MNVILIGINSKFIHTNMAVRYLKANCDFPTKILEFTIKDGIQDIYNSIILENPNILGFSCYIWNISIIKQLLKKIQSLENKPIIILGGPEVSYEFEEYLKNDLADFIVVNEGEITFNQLTKAIINNQNYDKISNLSYKIENTIKETTRTNIKDLTKLKNPYLFKEDIVNIPKKIQYVELSRGCPYKCSYCLASLEKGLRFFNLENVFLNIDYLISKGARTIKFLDRSFNANKKLALDFFKILIEKDYKDTVFQFEINGDVLDDEITDYLHTNLKKNYIRFELGVQSTNDIVNKSINRIQNTDLLIKNIKKLQSTNVILHLDLIAGLPFEDLSSFKNTFNQIFNLFSEELQLGFLKMVKGTKMRKEAHLHNYIYDLNPPYEIIENKYLSKNDSIIIHKVETFLEIYWNKGFMYNSLKYLIPKYKNPFDFFLDLSSYYDVFNLNHYNYQLYDLFKNLIQFSKEVKIYDSHFFDLLKLDYLAHHKIKPKIFWNNNFKKQQIIRIFHNQNQEFNIDELYKYTLVTEYQDGYLLVLYKPSQREFYYYTENQTKRISL